MQYQIICQKNYWQILPNGDNKALYEGKGPVQEALALAKVLGLDIVRIQETKEAA